jgi:hypothetical protein
MDDDKINMEDIEHQVKNEIMTTIENNPSKKAKEERIKKTLMDVMAIHKLLTKNFFEGHLRKNGNLAFPNTSNFGSNSGE